MKISFSPQLGAAPVAVSVTGDVLTVEGATYDFGPLVEGDILPRGAVECPWLVSDVIRDGGHICLTLILPHGPGAPQETLFPAAIIVTGDGPVALPPFARIEEPDA
ncbi:hypothetical protein PARHAE_02041 [Paracoccus haematequi]|uniref:Uncharacterized protein n=1 Tax=Paracoccus haematequi TaxID=2491866 RepID=A0A3S4GNF3_9RHOB|nr:hypothetical protein [Paracoccus haematequi]VDS08856.1 hypothetical protein PARHAE_02041 [Paracoccus haematequi]